MSCDPVRPKEVCAQAGSTGVPGGPSTYPERAEAVAVKEVYFGRKGFHLVLYAQAADEQGQIERRRVRCHLGEDLGKATNNPAYNGLVLVEMSNHSHSAELGVQVDGLEFFPYKTIHVSREYPLTWGQILNQKREIIRKGIKNAMEKGKRVPHEYLLENPDLIDPYLESMGGAREKDDDPASILRLRLKAGFPVGMNELVGHPELIMEYGVGAV